MLDGLKIRQKRTSTVLRSVHGHEVIYGPAGPGKTALVKRLLVDDESAGREVWIIDPLGASLPEWRDRAHRFGTSDDEETGDIISAVTDAIRDTAGDRKPVTVTINNAVRVFDEFTGRRLIERALNDAHKHDIRFRVVVNDLHVTSFGGSHLIRAALLYGSEAAVK